MRSDMVFETVLGKGVEPVRWLVIVGIAYTLATTIWSFFQTPMTPTRGAQTAAQTPAEQRPAVNVNWILSKNLFGEAGAAPADTSDDDEPAVQTRLPLELQSVFVADEIEHSAAIVAQRGKAGLLYSVGDKLPGNAELIEVLVDRIILRRAGVRETLMFPKSKTQFVADDYGSAGEDIDPTTGQAGQAPGRAGNAQQNDGDGPVAPPDQQELVEAYREKLAEDATGTLNELGIETVDDSGAGGYRIGDVSASPYLRQTGLQAGDVILSVNGRAVGDIQQDQLELENIMAQGSARIEVQRGGRKFFITASLK